MTRALWRLTAADLRRRPLAATLTVLVIAVAAATLTLALGVRKLSDDPWQRTFDATNGAHVVAFGDPASLAEVAALPGVAASSGDIPASETSFRRDGRVVGAHAYAVPAGGSPVAQPLVTEGRWVRPGGVVLERSFARYWHLEPGDRISFATTTGTTELEVAGVAVGASQGRYPESQPGTVFLDRAALRRIQPDESRWAHTLALRLDDPEATGAFTALVHSRFRNVVADDWHEDRADASENARINGIILSTFAVFLLLASGFVIANQVGARVLSQLRELGLLKAVGLTPRQIASVYALQHLLLGLVAVVLGTAIGALAAPLFLGPSAELLDAAATPVGLAECAIVAVAVLAVVGVVSFVPTWRAARRSTMDALAARGTIARPSRLARLATALRLPLPVVLGARDAYARRARAVLTTASLVLSVVVVVAALSMEASFAVEDANSRTSVAQTESRFVPAVGPRWDVFDDQSQERAQFRLIVYGLNAVLLVVALANLLTTALLAVRERVRDLGVLKAVGLTPSEVRLSVVSSQGVLALLAGVLGIPLGIAFFVGVYALANGSLDELGYAPWWQLALVVPGVVALVALVCGVPARLAARIRVVDALRYE